MNRIRQKGYNIIEIVVVVGVLALLLAMGVPAMSDWIANSRVRNAAEGTLSGLQLARAEAVRRNSVVNLYISAGGLQWDAAALDPAGDLVRIQTRPAEPTANVSCPAPCAALTAADNPTFFADETKATSVTVANATTVRFNGWGLMTTPNIQFPAAFAIRFSAPNARALCVAVVANTPKLCDPALGPANQLDPRACYFYDPQATPPAQARILECGN